MYLYSVIILPEPLGSDPMYPHVAPTTRCRDAQPRRGALGAENAERANRRTVIAGCPASEFGASLGVLKALECLRLKGC